MISRSPKTFGFRAFYVGEKRRYGNPTESKLEKNRCV